ncbi:hypothetical protein [Pedobacter sp. ok626]|nr:hypothetical protein [Pedobacter sp. ok626]
MDEPSTHEVRMIYLVVLGSAHPSNYQAKRSPLTKKHRYNDEFCTSFAII